MQAYGQTSVLEVVSPAGGYFSNGTISISWTLGEPVIGTLVNNDADLMLTQGFQQGNLFNVDVPTTDLPTLSIKMYPNPAIKNVFFTITNPEAKGEYSVDIYDITGRKILTENFGQFVDQEEKSLDVSSLKSGIYLVQAKVGNRVSKVLKLIKE
jgi:hypothetical protein